MQAKVTLKPKHELPCLGQDRADRVNYPLNAIKKSCWDVNPLQLGEKWAPLPIVTLYEEILTKFYLGRWLGCNPDFLK